jgi:hypothetical protein
METIEESKIVNPPAATTTTANEEEQTPLSPAVPKE